MKIEDTIGKNSGDRGREGREDGGGKEGEEGKEDGGGKKEGRRREEGSRKAKKIGRRKEGWMGGEEEYGCNSVLIGIVDAHYHQSPHHPSDGPWWEIVE